MPAFVRVELVGSLRLFPSMKENVVPRKCSTTRPQLHWENPREKSGHFHTTQRVIITRAATLDDDPWVTFYDSAEWATSLLCPEYGSLHAPYRSVRHQSVRHGKRFNIPCAIFRTMRASLVEAKEITTLLCRPVKNQRMVSSQLLFLGWRFCFFPLFKACECGLSTLDQN